MEALTNFLAPYKLYLYAGVAAIILALGVTVVIQHYKIKALKSDVSAQTTKLQVSNDSVTDLTKTLKDTTATLIAQEKADQKKQAEVDAALKEIDRKDKSLENMETRLNSRKSTSNCPVPKDLQDAWNSL